MKISDFLTLPKAAKYLGVSPNTLRNWRTAGKIKAFKNPLSGYWLFKKEDLDTFLNEIRIEKE